MNKKVQSPPPPPDPNSLLPNSIDPKPLDLSKSVLKNAPFRILLFWAVFAALVGACLTMIVSEVKFGDAVDQDCVFSSYSDWTGCERRDCSALAFRTRSILQQASGDGRPCQNAVLIETSTCDLLLNTCAVVACQYSAFGEWSVCPDTCLQSPTDCGAIATRVRTRSVLRTAGPGGTPCDWTSLVQTSSCPLPAFCSLTRECVPAAPAPDFSQCPVGCPAIGCTFSDKPLFTMCTTSNSLGPREDCQPNQLLYSRSCPYPECSDQCKNNNYSYFSRCTVPCGPGTQVTSTPNDCPTVTTGTCNLGNCATGAMDLIVVAAGVGGNESTCSASADDILNNGFSLSRCLAQCASDPQCNYAWAGSGNGVDNVTTSNVQPVNIGGIDQMWNYNPLSSNCIPPNWDMAAATCLYICETETANISFNHLTQYLGGVPYDPTRGLVFPFSTGSQSCPIKPAMLQEICPNSTVGRNSGLGVTPYLFEQYSQSSTQTVNISGVQYACPTSTPCIYESWSDAAPWGLCSQSPHENDEGFRSRVRRVLAPPTFLGDACDYQDMVETASCNRSETLGSASQMWCSVTADNTMEATTELNCFLACSMSRAENGEDSCNSMFIWQPFSVSTVSEVFIVSISGSAVVKEDVIDTITPILPAGFRLAYKAEVAAAWSSGFQFCAAPAWALSIQANPNSQPVALASAQQSTCSVFAANSLSDRTSNTPGGSKYFFVWGVKSQFTGNTSSTPRVGSAFPFFTPTSQAFFWDANYDLQIQQNQSDVSCAAFTDRTDILLNASSCSALNYRASQSNLYDVPYEYARNCSVTDWVNVQDCGNCIADSISTRSYVAPPSQGGLTCARTFLVTSTQCSPYMCDIEFRDVCIPQSLSTNSEYETSCTDPRFPADVYLDSWNYFPIYDWANFHWSATTSWPPLGGGTAAPPVFGTLSTRDFFTKTLRSFASDPDALLDSKLLDALNANCGTFTCLSTSSPTTYFSITAMGWESSTNAICEPNAVELCYTRMNSIPLTGKFVYKGGWECPSTCRQDGLSLSCDVNNTLPTCPCINPWQEAPPLPSPAPTPIEIPFLFRSLQIGERKYYSCNDGTVNETLSFRCAPVDYTQCASNPQCPVGNDGSQCNTASGFGSCVDLQNNTCTCIAPAAPANMDSQTCDRGCRVNPANNQTCTLGPSLCSYTLGSFTCQCPPGRFGDVCETAGTGIVGLAEVLYYNAETPFVDVNNTAQKIYFSFTNPEPRCEDRNPYCAGSQLFAPFNVTHPYYEYPRNNAVWPVFANICVNSNDAALNSQTWVSAKYLTRDLVNPQAQRVNCEEYQEFENSKLYHPYTLTAKFRAHPRIPPELHNKQFYTRCRNNDTDFNGGQYKFLADRLPQTDSDGVIFDIIQAGGRNQGLTLLTDICSGGISGAGN